MYIKNETYLAFKINRYDEYETLILVIKALLKPRYSPFKIFLIFNFRFNYKHY